MLEAFRGSCNRNLVLYEVKPNPSPPCKRQRRSDSSTSDFAFRGHESRISCVIPVVSQDEAVREAFPRILFDWPLGHKSSFFPKPIFQTHVEVSLEGPSRSEPLRTSLFFRCSSMSSAFHLRGSVPPPPALGYLVRRPGEEMDERVCGIPFDFLSQLGGLRCLILARQTRKA